MEVQPTRPAEILERLRAIMADALGLDVDRVYLTPDPMLVGRMPPAADRFGAVVLRAVRCEAEAAQHPGCWPCVLEVETCIYSRVAVDRPMDTTALLTDEARGLLTLADRLLAKLAGTELPTAKGRKRLLRGPMICQSYEPIRWAESGALVLAYLGVRWVAPFEYRA